MAKKVNRGLGKGLEALLGNMQSMDLPQNNPAIPQEDAVTPPTPEEKKSEQSTAEIPIDKISVNPFQPRTQFDQQALQELADSIKLHGIIQPITVRSMGDGTYQLISGERRLRASQIAELANIPAYVRKADDQMMQEAALIENIQREDLNPIEIARSLKLLQEKYNITQEALQERVNKDRTTISNYQRLLKLPPSIQHALLDKSITMGHAKALLALDGDLINQLSVFQKTIKNGLSVRKTEALVKAVKAAEEKEEKEEAPSETYEEYKNAREKLSKHLGVKVKIKHNDQTGKGELQIPFQSVEDFNQIMELLDIIDLIR